MKADRVLIKYWSEFLRKDRRFFVCSKCGYSLKHSDISCPNCSSELSDRVILQQKKEDIVMDLINKKVIVRGNCSGVFFGTLVNKDGGEVTLENCRRLWRWGGAASISQLAVDGTMRPEDCKFTVAVNSIVILDAIEIIPCSETAICSIEGVEEWKM